jgi:hypothetical protein
VFLLNLGVRYVAYRLLSLVRPSEALKNRLAMYKVALKWHHRIEPLRFIQTGEEPESGYEPLAPAPKMMEAACACGIN